MCGTIQDQGGSGGVPLAACQLILATCQKLGNDGRIAGKVPKCVKVPEPKHRASAMRGVRLYVYYIYFVQ